MEKINPVEFFRVCSLCGRLPFIRGAILCLSCEREVLGRSKLYKRGREGWASYSLWKWDDHHSFGGEIVRKLKGGGPAPVYDYFAELYLSRWLNGHPGFEFSKSIFVPAPPRDETGYDHAFCLARSFAKWTGSRHAQPLRRVTNEQQKFHDEAKRATLRFDVTSKIDRTQNIIFVDDVIVTGNTAKGAYEALNRPPTFMAWCLVDRARLI